MSEIYSQKKNQRLHETNTRNLKANHLKNVLEKCDEFEEKFKDYKEIKNFLCDLRLLLRRMNGG